MREFCFTITEHDPNRPWIVVGCQHRAVRLDEGVSFYNWAHERWPEPRWTVQLDPWQLTTTS
jgi:hypothetical protein